MTNDPCRAERVMGAPLLGTCSKPKGHTGSPDPADHEHLDEETGEQWSKSQ
jgi:hypothetical protein